MLVQRKGTCYQQILKRSHFFKIVEIPKYIEKIIYTERVEIVPKVIVKELEQERVKWIDVEKEHVIDRPKFREKVVDVIKPHYKCQKCNFEV